MLSLLNHNVTSNLSNGTAGHSPRTKNNSAQLGNLPDELKTSSQWVTWAKKAKPSGNGFTKIPMDAKTGTAASVTDPHTWCAYPVAIETYECRRGDGVGFVLTEHDPFCGVDLDHCRDPQTGHLTPWAGDIVERLNSYTEITPSGEGIRVWVKARLSGTGGNSGNGVEIYDQRRFFTMTGEHIGGTPTTIEERQDEIDALYLEHFPDKVRRGSTGNDTTAHPSPSNAERVAILADLKQALSWIPAVERTTWLAVGMALHSLGGDIGYDMWRTWSQTCPEKYNAADNEKAWRSFKNDGAGISYKSIFYLAREQGWKPATYRDAQENERTCAQERPIGGQGTVAMATALSSTATDTPPAIQLNNRQLREVRADTLTALVRGNSPPSLFVCGRQLARIVEERGQPIIDTLNEAALSGRLTKVADFVRVKINEKSGTVVQTKVFPALDVIRDILSLPAWPFPALDGLIACPALRPDGSIISAPGYDAATLLYHTPAPGLNVPPVADSPSAADAQKARMWLHEEVLSDFPWVSDADLANYLALLITPIVRPAIRGQVPLCLLDKPTPGSGASLLSDLVSLVALGQTAAKMTAPEGMDNENEWRKRITAALTDGPALIVIDNLDDALASSALSAALTTSRWKDRILGQSRMITLPVRCTWAATGNNIRLRGDIARRSYRVRIDAALEQPWTRKNFRHPNLTDWVTEHRGELLAAVLTMARAWYVAGQPEASERMRTIGSFEQWQTTVGGILAFAGVSSFLGNQDSVTEALDESVREWRAFFRAWHDLHGEKLMTVRELTHLSAALPHLLDAMPDSVAFDCTKLDSSRIRLGKALQKHQDRMFGGYRLTREVSDAHANAATWRIARVH